MSGTSRTRPLCAALAAALLSLAGCGGPGDPVAEARRLQDEQRFQDSIPVLREALSETPDDPEANYLLGLALLQTGEPSAALWPLRRAARSEERGVEAGVVLAQTLGATQNYEESESVASAVLEREPDHREAIAARAHALLRQSRYEDALADIDRLRGLQPDDMKLLLVRAEALESMKRFEEAVADLERAETAHRESGEFQVAAVACARRVGALQKADESDQKRALDAIEGCLEAYPTDLTVLQSASQLLNAAGENERAVAAWRKAVADAPETLELRLGLADQLITSGRQEEGVEEARQAAEEFGSMPAWAALAQVQRRANDLEGAYASLEKAEALSPEPDRIRFERADLLVERGDLEAAEAVAGQLEEPSYAAIIRGRVQLKRGDAAAALASFEEGLTRWPNNPGARAEAGRAAQELGDLERALQHYRESARANAGATNAALGGATIALALGRYDEALGLIGVYIASHPYEGPEPYLVGIRAAEATQQLGIAANILKALEAQGGRGPALAERARRASETDGPAAAERLIEQSDLALDDPSNEPALRALVDARIAQGDGAGALAAVDAVLAKDPQRSSVREMRGRVLLALGQQQEARAAFDAAIAADPDYGPALAGLGVLAFAAGDLPGALERFEAAAAGDPPDPDAGYRAAQVLQAQGRTDEAERRLRRVLATTPDHVGAANDLAWLLAERNVELDQALALAQRAVSAAPSAHTLDTLAWVELRRGDPAAAIATLDRGLEANPNDPTLLFRLGLARKAAGDRAGALEAFRGAVGSEGPQADAARAEIAALEGGEDRL